MAMWTVLYELLSLIAKKNALALRWLTGSHFGMM
jgi:hypothetical protein